MSRSTKKNCGRLNRVRYLGQQLPGLTRKSPNKRQNAPGQHGPEKRSKPKDYSLRLHEAQKLRFNYGVKKKDLLRYFRTASSVKGDTGQMLLTLLESRLDNIVFRAGFAPTIPAARQLVNHGHVLVKRKRATGSEEFTRITIPSFSMRPGDVISIKEKSRNLPPVMESMETPSLEIPTYITLKKDTFEAQINASPERDDIPVQIQENLIVEHFSRVA